MHTRIQIVFLGIIVVIAAIIVRLAYWQIIRGPDLRLQARAQYTSTDIVDAERGSILFSDGSPLVLNTPVYSLGAYTPALKDSPSIVADRLIPLLHFDIDDPEIATDAAKAAKKLVELQTSARATMIERMNKGGYAVLASSLTVGEKNAVAALNIPGLVFDQSYTREYPEASMSAALTGFVGRDDVGLPTGYFGLEGFYNRELSGRASIEQQERDAAGNPLLVGNFNELPGRNGRDLRLYLDRGVQFIAEDELKKAIDRYGASSGDVVIMDPKTGGILAMASWPSYSPDKFYNFDPSLYKNPLVADTYEPGSTFKVLIMAAAFNENVIKEDDHCDICTGAYPIGQYLIRTWDGKYHPQATPEDIIVHSDNVGMVWTEQKLGGERMFAYLKNYGFGQKTGIDLQEEVSSNLRDRWGDIDYATASFGQGIAVTSIQMIRAVAAIANGGLLMEPHVVSSVAGDTAVDIQPKVVRRVFSEDAARKVTALMVAAVEKGEAKWTKISGYRVAGKTGTAQIPVQGHYDSTKTIASFVGFAPADNPRFVMLVKLREPKTSPWGSETAAPLWFAIARKLLLEYNIPPTN